MKKMSPANEPSSSGLSFMGSLLRIRRGRLKGAGSQKHGCSKGKDDGFHASQILMRRFKLRLEKHLMKFPHGSMHRYRVSTAFITLIIPPDFRWMK
jgi:hypothetical protein